MNPDPVAITLVNYRAPEQHSCILYDVVIFAVLIRFKTQIQSHDRVDD